MPNHPGPMACPVDGTTLVMSERSGIEIDYCPSCRGVWLDRGELDRILARERSASVADPDKDFFDEVEGRGGRERQGREGGHGYGDHEYGGKKRRKRSLLEDLLDF